MIGAQPSCFEIPPRYEWTEARIVSSRRNGRRSLVEKRDGCKRLTRIEAWEVPHFTSQPFQGCRELSKHLVPNVAFGNVGLKGRNRFAVQPLKPRNPIGSG